MSEPYTPGIGQAVFGNPTGAYEISAIGQAAISFIINEAMRVVWNVTQSQFDWFSQTSVGNVELRPYHWGDDEADADKPNLAFRPVEVRWYKHPGRGMSVNRPMTPDDWSNWLKRVLWELEAYERIGPHAIEFRPLPPAPELSLSEHP